MASPAPDLAAVLRALRSPDSSTRLQAALSLGTLADPATLDALVERCAVEPDFFVRDMLTWALTRLPADSTVPRLVAELGSPVPQAQSQALHTLSKIGDPAAWPAIPDTLLFAADDEVARTAWRTAVVLAPESEHGRLAAILVAQLGRGELATQLSLSRALVALGDVVEPALARAATASDAVVRAHARATLTLLDDPEAGFAAVLADAQRFARE